jgi:hypothetical protein
MVRLFGVSVLLVMSVLAASAQPAAQPDENSAAPATRTPETLENFAKSFVTPTRRTGKIARWESGICPLTVGQPPAFTAYVTKRVKDVGAMVGAPVNAASDCRPNIEIVFTTTPQALLNDVRARQVELLGFAETSAQREKLAMVTRPLQAWYATQTRDLHGTTRIDSSRHTNAGMTMTCFTCLPCPFCKGLNAPFLELPDAHEAVAGSSLSDGTRSSFFHVIVVADANRLAGYQIGPLSDYIAVLALAQINSLDTCQQLPSIVNMLAAGCEQKSADVTENDLAYLRGLYRMSSEKSFIVQQNEIASQMSEPMGR